MPHRSRTGRLDGSVGNFGNAKISQHQMVVIEQNEILGLDVAVNNSVLMRVSDGLEHLAGKIEREFGRKSLLQSLSQALFSQRKCHDQMLVNDFGILEA